MLIPLVESGQIKSTGVSNYNLAEIKRSNEILNKAGTLPTIGVTKVNQLEDALKTAKINLSVEENEEMEKPIG